jgi:hypothetical protein
VVHNWVVVEGKKAAVGGRRRCIVAVEVAPVELPQGQQSKDPLGNTMMHYRQKPNFVAPRESRRLR